MVLKDTYKIKFKYKNVHFLNTTRWRKNLKSDIDKKHMAVKLVKIHVIPTQIAFVSKSLQPISINLKRVCNRIFIQHITYSFGLNGLKLSPPAYTYSENAIEHAPGKRRASGRQIPNSLTSTLENSYREAHLMLEIYLGNPESHENLWDTGV